MNEKVCFRCRGPLPDSTDETWENACPRCGCLAWLHRGDRVRVQVRDTRRLESGQLAAVVTLGDGLDGVAELHTPATPNQWISCDVVQIDHQARRVFLRESPK